MAGACAFARKPAPPACPMIWLASSRASADRTVAFTDLSPPKHDNPRLNGWFLDPSADADKGAGFAERDPLLIVFGDHRRELAGGDREAVSGARPQQLIDRSPTRGVESHADRFGLVSQDQAQELADFNVTAVHLLYSR